MVIANSNKTTVPSFVIADISQADFGRKELNIAETEMPGLIALREKYKSTKHTYISLYNWLSLWRHKLGNEVSVLYEIPQQNTDYCC